MYGIKLQQTPEICPDSNNLHYLHIRHKNYSSIFCKAWNSINVQLLQYLRLHKHNHVIPICGFTSANTATIYFIESEIEWNVQITFQ